LLPLKSTSAVGFANYQTNFHVALKECGMKNTLKIKLTVLFLNNFSNAPAGHFHKQKVMLPCTLNMRKGVKGLKPIHC
jgi:hypothetical protein